MNWFGGAEKLIGKVNEIHEKFVETQTEFRLVREQTQRTLDEFKSALERLSAKVDTLTGDETRAHAELKAEIRGLELRLNALSEQALHAVAEKVAREGMRTLRLDPELRNILPPPDTEESS